MILKIVVTVDGMENPIILNNVEHHATHFIMTSDTNAKMIQIEILEEAVDMSTYTYNKLSAYWDVLQNIIPADVKKLEIYQNDVLVKSVLGPFKMISYNVNFLNNVKEAINFAY